MLVRQAGTFARWHRYRGDVRRFFCFDREFCEIAFIAAVATSSKRLRARSRLRDAWQDV
jgi:hypothetical protein